MNRTNPIISIIVPVFNRAQFLEQLFTSISKQTCDSYELIVVDDGSTDNTETWISDQRIIPKHKVQYYFQNNSGPYAARNLGIKHASGKYIAFQDSDDEWPTYHLEELLSYMELNHDVDWLFGYITRIDHHTRKTVQETNFVLSNGETHPFIKLNCEERERGLKVIDDNRAGETAISYTVPGSTQCAMIRKTVFENNLFDPAYRTAFDRFFAIKLVLEGYKFAYVNRVHQIYHIHDSHISLVVGGDTNKLEKSALTMLKGYSFLLNHANNRKERTAIHKQLAEVYSWQLSYAYQLQGKFFSSTKSMFKAWSLYPYDFRYTKSLLACLVRMTLIRNKPPTES